MWSGPRPVSRRSEVRVIDKARQAELDGTAEIPAPALKSGFFAFGLGYARGAEVARGEVNGVPQSSTDMVRWITIEVITGDGGLVERCFKVDRERRFFRAIRK